MRKLFIWTKSDTNWKKLEDYSEPGDERGGKKKSRIGPEPLSDPSK